MTTTILELEPNLLDRRTVEMCAAACLTAQIECKELFRRTKNKCFRAAFFEYGRKWGAFRSALLTGPEEREAGEPPALVVDTPPKLLYCTRCGRSNFWPLYYDHSEERQMYQLAGGELVCEDCI